MTDSYEKSYNDTFPLGGYSSQSLSASAMGNGWTLLGTVTLGDLDTSTSITVSNGGSPITNVCLMQWVDVATSNSDGTLSSETDALGNTTTYIYNSLGQPGSAPIRRRVWNWARSTTRRAT